MQHLGRVLIVEPDAKAAEVLVRECARLRRTHLTATAAAAREQLASRPSITALIVEHSLPDARGITLLDEFRGAYPYTPSLMLTAAFDAALLNRCHLLRAEFVAKPAHRHNVRAFLRRSVAFERVPDRRVAQLVDELVLAVRLSPRETDVLAAAMQGVPRKIIADQIGTTDNTIKS